MTIYDTPPVFCPICGDEIVTPFSYKYTPIYTCSKSCCSLHITVWEGYENEDAAELERSIEEVSWYQMEQEMKRADCMVAYHAHKEG